MFRNKGLTLVELLITIVIIGVLAAIAIPSYSNYMVRARRADAKTGLEQFRAAQEMRRAERGSYSVDIAELRNTWGVPGAAGDYDILLINTGANAFTGEARPRLARQLADGSLFIDHLGNKTPADKWAK
jgi:type IV pilus assembly protein PilE